MTQTLATTRSLTEAEHRVVAQLPSNQTNQQIADRLGLTEDTVKSHLQRISGRWQVQGRIAITVRAYELGMIPLPNGPEIKVLRSALAAIGRLVGVRPREGGVRPEAVVRTVRNRVALTSGAGVALPPDWRTQIESHGGSASHVIQLIEGWQARA
jgi:DNA-binding CsgD family transcriptional regulator